MKFVLLLGLLSTLFSFNVQAQRTRPGLGWIVYQRWDHLGFLHWEVDAQELKKHIPAPLELDTWQGRAFVGVVAFRMTTGRAPLLPIPLYNAFGQVNLRTYVTYKGKRGVYFFTLDAAHRLGSLVADAVFKLPYIYSDVQFKKVGNVVRLKVNRKDNDISPAARFDVTFRKTGSNYVAAPGSLDHWQTELMRYYQVDDEGCVITSELWHVPFTIYRAVGHVASNSIDTAAALPELAGQPVFHYSPGIDTWFWPPRKLSCL